MGYMSEKYSKNINSYIAKPENPTYTNAKSLYMENGPQAVYIIKGVYIAEKGEYPHPCVLIDGNIMVDWPPHMMEKAKDIRSDKIATELINKGFVGFSIHTYKSKKRKEDCYGIDIIDLDTMDDGSPSPDDSMPFPVD